MQKRLKCQASRKLLHLTLCIALVLPCLASGKENASREASRIEYAQKVREAIRRTVSEAHRSKAAAMQARPKHETAMNAKKSMTASSVTKPGTQATSTSNGQLHGTKANTTWSSEAWPISNSLLTRFEKRSEYRFEEDFLPGTARVNLLMDRNNDGVIDPMERALGRIGMTAGGDAGLRESEMVIERLSQQDRIRSRPTVSSAKIAKSESRLSCSPKSLKRQSQGRL